MLDGIVISSAEPSKVVVIDTVITLALESLSIRDGRGVYEGGHSERH